MLIIEILHVSYSALLSCHQRNAFMTCFDFKQLEFFLNNCDFNSLFFIKIGDEYSSTNLYSKKMSTVLGPMIEINKKPILTE